MDVLFVVYILKLNLVFNVEDRIIVENLYNFKIKRYSAIIS